MLRILDTRNYFFYFFTFKLKYADLFFLII